MFDNLSNYFSDEHRALIKEGIAAWHQLKRHEGWKGWLCVGETIAATQDLAARVTGQTSGMKFNAFMASCYAKPTYLGGFAEIHKTARSFAAKCWRHREEIEAWRTKIGQDRALQLNHPKNVWQAYEASRRTASPAPKPSPLEQKLAEAQAEIARLKKQPTAKDEKAMERLQVALKMAEADRQRFSRLAEETPKLKAEIARLTKDGPPWAQGLRRDNAQLRREHAWAKLPPDAARAKLLEENLELRRQVEALKATPAGVPTNKGAVGSATLTRTELDELLLAFSKDHENDRDIDLRRQRATAMLIERRKKSGKK